MTAYLFAALVAVVLVVSMLFLLRRRRVSEKYAGIWIVLALAVVVLVVFPGLSFALARLVGSRPPSTSCSCSGSSSCSWCASS